MKDMSIVTNHQKPHHPSSYTTASCPLSPPPSSLPLATDPRLGLEAYGTCLNQSPIQASHLLLAVT